LSYGGKDVSEAFGYFHAKDLLKKYGKLVIGKVEDGSSKLGNSDLVVAGY
jgi:hypothetical protein